MEVVGEVQLAPIETASSSLTIDLPGSKHVLAEALHALGDALAHATPGSADERFFDLAITTSRRREFIPLAIEALGNSDRFPGVRIWLIERCFVDVPPPPERGQVIGIVRDGGGAKWRSLFDSCYRLTVEEVASLFESEHPEVVAWTWQAWPELCPQE
jgi:hypothetical protein